TAEEHDHVELEEVEEDAPQADQDVSQYEHSSSLWRLPLSEDGGAHTDLGGALLDRHFEVVAHPHRQRAATHQSLAPRLPEELAQAAEVGASLFGIVRERRQHHEAFDVHGLVVAELLEGRE